MWLALDTATDLATVALRLDDGRMLEAEQAGARSHARAVLPLASALLDEGGVTLDDLRGVIVADGPGSFTGLRVGASVAKALVATRAVELRTAPSLLARAAGVAGDSGDATVLAVADALRGEVYAARYRFTRDAVTVLEPPRVRRPDDLVAGADRPDLLVGDAPGPVLRRLEEWAGIAAVHGAEAAPRASCLLALLEVAGATRAVSDPAGWEPDYGRPAEAQARWEEAHGRALPDSLRAPG